MKSGKQVRLSDYLDLGGASDVPVVSFGSESLTRRELTDAVDARADHLRAVGVGPGSVVGVRLFNSLDAVVTMLSIWRAEAAVAPISPLLSDAEASDLVVRVRPDAFVSAPEDGHLVASSRDAAVGGTLVASSLDLGPGVTPRKVQDGAAVVLHTSGTSGQPKAVVIEHRSIVGAIESLMKSLGARGSRSSGRGAPNLLVFPLFHVAGIYNLALALRNDRELILMRKFVVDEFVDIIEHRKIPSVVLNPTMIHMLNEDEDVEPDRLSCLRFVRSGSAPLPVAVAQRFRERFGVSVLNAYGQTETAGEVIGWTAADIKAHAEDKVGSVGRPHSNVDVRFIDESGADVAAGEVGELCVRSPFLMGGYLDADAAEKFDSHGYLRTGDLGYVDADGFVWLVGRRTDVIICGGFKVMPEQVEDVLRRHPDVAEVMVAGVTDDRLGEAPHAFVVPRRDNPSLPTELTDLARQELARYRVPRAFHLVDALPRNETGKIVRSRAQELLPAAAS